MMGERGLEHLSKNCPVTHSYRGKKMRQQTEHLEFTFSSDALHDGIVPTKIVRRKTIVLKSRIDVITARLLGQKLKRKLFDNTGSGNTKLSQIHLASIDKNYEQYRIVGGKYAIDYCKKLVFTIKVAKNAQEVTIFDKKFTPEQDPNAQKIVNLNFTEHFHHEDKASLILDKTGREVNLEQLKYLQFNEQTDENVAKVASNLSDAGTSADEEVDILISKIVNRPADVGEVSKEVFEVNERILVYCPMYQITFRNLKTKEETVVTIDGIEGKMISQKRLEPPKDEPVTTPIQPHSWTPIIKGELVNRKTTPQSIEDMFDIESVPSTDDLDLNGEKTSLEFPAKVDGEIFRVGDNVTAIVGDIEIPSGTTVSETLVVKGNLKTGTNCKLLGNVKALKDVTIGENTTIIGKVTSGRNITVGKNAVIHGSVESKGTVKLDRKATIEGGLSSKSSVTLEQNAKVLGTINAAKGISVMN